MSVFTGIDATAIRDSRRLATALRCLLTELVDHSGNVVDLGDCYDRKDVVQSEIAGDFLLTALGGGSVYRIAILDGDSALPQALELIRDIGPERARDIVRIAKRGNQVIPRELDVVEPNAPKPARNEKPRKAK
jgi:hypothetical protein